MNSDQKKLLLSLFEYLKDNNRFFNDIFLKNNIDFSDDIDQCFSRMPILEKSDIRNNYKSYISDSQQEHFNEKTSGSTGIPLICPKTRSERLTAGLNAWNKRREWDPQVNIDNFLPLHDPNTYKLLGNFFDYNPENMKNCFGRLQEISPRWLSGPASAIERYCRLIQSGHIKYEKKSIRFIELAGEYVDVEQRQFIESVLECKTINHYGTIETWCIAYECCKGHLHVNENMFFVELAKTAEKFDGQDETGEIVVTSFYNRLMPIVRYNLKDIGRVSYLSCECGKTSQVIELMGGRSGDVIAGEKQILGEVFFKRGIYKLINRGYDCIDGFRVEQVELKKFIFYIKKGNGYAENVTGILLEYIRSNLGKDTCVEFEFADSIPPLPSGKTKIFHSNLTNKK
jgi:phenylacetate-CoA ligase